MSNPDIPKQPQHDLETEADARRRRNDLMLGYVFGVPMPRRIIDGPRASHYESYPGDYPPVITGDSDMAGDDALIISYTSDENGWNVRMIDPKAPDAANPSDS